MQIHIRPATALALVTIFVAFLVAVLPAFAANAIPAQSESPKALDGEWIFFEDRTEGRTLEQLSPPMSSKFSMRVEEGAIILNGHGSGHRDVRVALDGTVTEIKEPKSIARYRGSWKDSTFEYEVAFERLGGAPEGIKAIKRKFRKTTDGLVVTVAVDPPMVKESTGIYRHAADIPMPTAVKAKIDNLAWLAGAWVGTRGTTGSSIEERWSPPLGGAMLAVSRTVNAAGKMVGFEYLRIVERDGGLVYLAQPAGNKATEFVLSELTAKRAVFENPRHDYPQRIMYELSESGELSTSVGQTKGGTPRRDTYKRESTNPK